MPPPTQGEYTVLVSKPSSDSGSSKSDKTKQSKGTNGKSKAPTTCRSSEGFKISKKSEGSSTRPSKPSNSKYITTPIPQATTQPTAFSRPLVPATTNVPAPTSSSYSPTSGSTQKETPPIFSTTTNSPASDSPTPSPSDKPTPSPSDKPVTSPPTPFPTPDVSTYILAFDLLRCETPQMLISTCLSSFCSLQHERL